MISFSTSMASPPRSPRSRARQGGRLLAQGVSPGNDVQTHALLNPAKGVILAPLAGRQSIGGPPFPGLAPWAKSLPPSGLGLCAIMRCARGSTMDSFRTDPTGHLEATLSGREA